MVGAGAPVAPVVGYPLIVPVQTAIEASRSADTAPQPPMDYGFMYAHGFTDLDGHIWELMYMDMSAAPPEMQPPQPAGTPSGSPDHQATT